MKRFPRFASFAILALAAFAGPAAAQALAETPRAPSQEEFTHSLNYRWLNKTVHESRLLHDMERLSGWSVTGPGRIELTEERSIGGSSSLRFQTPLRDEALINRSPGGRMMGSAAAVLTFDREQDWSRFNRIALWVYIHPGSFRVHTFYLTFSCVDAPEAITEPKYATVIQGLTPGQWNYVLWEIPNLRRDRVTELRIMKLLTGHDAQEDGAVTYDFDQLELQRVDAEAYEGWPVAPGKLAYNHVGYKPSQSKVALAGDLSAPLFQLREARSGWVVLSKPVAYVRTERGAFQVLDFSEVRTPGEYFLWAGDRTSRPFEIGDTLWLGPIRKAINSFYALRCGFDVPGVHPECHADCRGYHEDEKKIINGGWHDAGDLSQGSFRTSMATYAMLEIARQLEGSETETALRERTLEEARWGLDWLLKTRFSDGYRITWNGMGLYTDGILGTTDDVLKPAQNIPWENFIASGVEALAHQVFRDSDPELARRCLQAAEEDWQAAVQLQSQWLDAGRVHVGGSDTTDHQALFSHRWFSGGTYLTLSWGILSSLHLYEATGRSAYAERAVEYGAPLLRCQERAFLDGIPLTGFFYSSPEKAAIVNHRHAAFEESPLLALRALCEAFPDREEWIEWYGAAALHSEYFLKRGARFTAPYSVLPNAVFRRADIEAVSRAELREAMLRQFEEGTPLSEEYHLRFFPIWTTKTHHGNTAVHLSQTVALAAAAGLRNDLALEDLAATQLQWVFGGNPFSQTLMYGEGYDYPPLYGYNPGDIVGAFPVGVDCVRNDEPFWSASNHATFKEIWGVPASRFLWSAASLAMPASVRGVVKGAAPGPIGFVNRTTGTRTEVQAAPGGEFQAELSPGAYDIQVGSALWKLTLVSGGHYALSLDPERSVHFALKSEREPGKSSVRLRLTAQGRGRHDFSIRVFNGAVLEHSQSLDLAEGRASELLWDIAVPNRKTPWVAVVIPDGDHTWKQEATGTLEEG